jgi:hypothetical protein
MDEEYRKHAVIFPIWGREEGAVRRDAPHLFKYLAIILAGCALTIGIVVMTKYQEAWQRAQPRKFELITPTSIDPAAFAQVSRSGSLPIYPGAITVHITEYGGIHPSRSASFTVREKPEVVLAFYNAILASAGWEIAREGSTDHRGVWRHKGRMYEITVNTEQVELGISRVWTHSP